MASGGRTLVGSTGASLPRTPRAWSGQTAEALVQQLVQNLGFGTLEEIYGRQKKLRGKGNRSSASADSLGNVPSDLTSYRVWKQYQDGDKPTFCCHRPPHAVPELPLLLVSEAFTQFKINAATVSLEERDITLATKFWNRLHSDEYINDHDNEVDKINLLLSDYWDVSLQRMHIVGRVQADGMVLNNRTIRLGAGYKSQPGNSGDPFFELLDYFKRASEILAKKTCRSYALGFCLLGCYNLLLLGLTMEAGSVWAEPLAETRCYGDQDALEATARIWKAVGIFLHSYQEMEMVSPPVPWPLRQEPNLRPLVPKSCTRNKLIFTVDTGTGEQVVAKLTKRYCTAAHHAWRGSAAKLHEERECGAGWKLVKMDYLSPQDGWLSCTDVVRAAGHVQGHLEKVSRCIVAAAKEGHSRNYVHGDLRVTNILLRPGGKEADGYPSYKAGVVDFEWAGRIGEARYLTVRNPLLEWPPGVEFGALIQPAHDLWFASANNLLGQVQLLDKLEKAKQPKQSKRKLSHSDEGHVSERMRTGSDQGSAQHAG